VDEGLEPSLGDDTPFGDLPFGDDVLPVVAAAGGEEVGEVGFPLSFVGDAGGFFGMSAMLLLW
jgi:hypothetical protein